MIKTGRVVRIFDDEKIAINLGSRDGLTRGARIAIYAPEVEIEDPDTGEVLGSYRHLKAAARAAEVAEKFTVAGPYPRKEQVSEPSAIWAFRQTRTKTVPGELPINEMEASPLPGGDEIRVGDIVEVEFDDSPPPAPTEAQEAADLGG
jgi:hypothetical protein